jgi:hypothetical protein
MSSAFQFDHACLSAADYLAMPRVATFMEMLEQELMAFQTQGPVSAPAAPPPLTYRAPHPFLFARARFHFRATAYGSVASKSAASRTTRLVRPLPPPPPPPPRSLTASQQRAMEKMIRLGADLSADFTARELRTAYRTLARRFHPDRHPASTDSEKAGLARVFADLNESHQRLLRALREPPPTVHS